MSFGAQLKDSLHDLEDSLTSELKEGGSLSRILDRYLMAVERASGTDMLTSVLLLEGKGLRHAAAPSLPKAYCEAIDGSEIGPRAGSCGTAAFLDRAIYVEDIAEDPLWEDYRQYPLAHGLRACWSTPIHGERGEVIGTFAIYHLTPRAPSREEVEAIATIIDHVGRAIRYFGGIQDLAAPGSNGDVSRTSRLAAVESDFEALAAMLRKSIAGQQGNPLLGAEAESLQRALAAAEKGAKLARGETGGAAE